MKMYKKFNTIQRQAKVFGAIDPTIYLVVSLFILISQISLVNNLHVSDAITHTLIGVSIGVVCRISFQVYKQNWKKFPIFGVFRIVFAELLTACILYAIEHFSVLKNVPLVHILSISLITIVCEVGYRMLYYAYHHKKDGNNKIYLSSPTMYEEEQKYIDEAFDRNWVAPLGFNCDGFESEMVEYLSNDEMHAFATSSGTGALHLAAKLAGIKPGDIILCSDLTFAATVNPMTYEGGKLVFIDSEYDTWNMSPEALEEGFKKYPEAKVVVLVHLYGTPAKIDEIIEICRRHNAVLIEDAAEALGASYKGEKCGTFGNYNVLSFNGNKIITTSGGGMLLTNNKQDRDRALFLGTQARENTIWYEHKEVGYNYRMSNVVAGIGRGQLCHLDQHKSKKAAIYFTYKEGFKDREIEKLPIIKEGGVLYTGMPGDNGHHYTTEYTYKYVLPTIDKLLNFGFSMDDFNKVKVDNGVYDLSYLKPKKEEDYAIICFTNGERKSGNYDILLHPEFNKRPLYRELYRHPHTCTRIVNRTTDSKRKLMISGDSQMIPSIAPLAHYFKEIWYFDNRTGYIKNKKTGKFEFKEDLFKSFSGTYKDVNFTDVLIECYCRDLKWLEYWNLQ